ncbi:hypothetical protein OS493_031459 [Desmophyllum pertusum]|uniref:Uncharacterized protein n=1 Tax=Desmophyllum pertusum TaxID=174260 RepID=A0A9X0D6Q7_9CNID|nr:hypothetical protein OS493_031459 [Desmophyllum pertusum]
MRSYMKIEHACPTKVQKEVRPAILDRSSDNFPNAHPDYQAPVTLNDSGVRQWSTTVEPDAGQACPTGLCFHQ